MGRQDLYNAIKTGDVIGVKAFFRNASKEQISEALCCEVENGHNILQYILDLHIKERKSDNIKIFTEVFKHCNYDLINKQDKNRQIPLLLAIQAGPEFVDLFQDNNLNKGEVQQGVNWKVVDSEDRGLLYHTIMDQINGFDHDEIKLCDLVFKNKEFPYHVSVKNVNEDNILHQIFKNPELIDGRQLRIHLLLDKLDDFQNDPSIWRESLSSERLLNEKNKQGDTPAHLLIRNGIIDKLFRNNGQDTVYDIDRLFKNCNLLECDEHGNSVINLAVEKGNDLLIQYVLEKLGDKEKTELKYALIENLNDQNYAILQHNDMLVSCSPDDKDLISKIEKGYAKLSTLDTCERYHGFIQRLNLGQNVNLTKCAVESNNLALIEFLRNNDLLDKGVFLSEVVKVKNPDFLRKVFPILSVRDPLEIFNVYKPEVTDAISYISPEVIFEMFDDRNIATRRANLVVNFVKMLANNVDLFDNIINSLTPTQLRKFIEILHHTNSSLKDGQLVGMTHSSDLIDCLRNVEILDDKIKDFTIKCARSGQYDNIVSLIDGNNDLIYSQKDGKSLLEIASDSGNINLVRYLIAVHKSLIDHNKSGYIDQNPVKMEKVRMSFSQLAKIYHEDVIAVLKLNESFINDFVEDEHNLADVILNSANEANNDSVICYCRENHGDVLRDIPTPSYSYVPKVSLERDISSIASKELENHFSMDRIGEFGIFAKYIRPIQSGNLDVFKQDVVDQLNENVKEYALRSHADRGHSIFTITAALGTADQWKKLSTGYKSVARSKKIKSIFPNDPLNGNRVSSICSPFQAAIIACNKPMVDLFINEIESSELTREYGKDNNNVLHTAIEHSQVNIIDDIFNSKRFSISVLAKAFLQPNANGVTPFMKAVESGKTKICRDFVLLAKEQMKVKQLRDLITNENFVNAIVKSGDVALLKEVLSIEQYVNKSNPKQKICFIKHKLGKYSLLTYACKCGNTRFLEALMDSYSVEELTSLLKEVISEKSTISPEVLDKFIHYIIHASSDGRIIDKIFECALEYDNPLAIEILEKLQAVSRDEVINKLTISDAIEHGRQDILRHLLNVKRQDFKVPDSPMQASELGLAICSPKVSEVCCDYLKSRPEGFSLDPSVVPHGAILSNNIELLRQIISKDVSLVSKSYDFSTECLQSISNELGKHYKCKPVSFESLCDFASRVNASPEIQNYLQLSLLKSCYNSLENSSEIEVNNALVNAVVNHAQDVHVNCEDLFSAVVDGLNVIDLLCNANPIKNNIFHSCTKENAEFLSRVAKRCHDYAKETGNRDLEKLVSNMVNQVNPSNGLSFFHFLALNSDYKSYETIKSSCGNINSLTAGKAHLVHLCAKSGMKDNEGRFEFQNLIENDQRLAKAVDANKSGLLVYAASGSAENPQLRAEAVRLITSLGKRLDGNLGKSSKNYVRKALMSAFTSRNKGIFRQLSMRARNKGYTFSQQRIDLFHEIENTTDPVKKGQLLLDEYELSDGKGHWSEREDKTEKVKSPAQPSEEREEGVTEERDLSRENDLDERSSDEGSIDESLEDEKLLGEGKSPGDLLSEDIQEERLLEENEIIVSRAKKEILDSQDEINLLIDSDVETAEYISAINKLSNPVAILQFKTLSGLSIAEHAFLNGNTSLIEALICSNKKLDPNITDSQGNTLLHNFVMFFEKYPAALSNQKMQTLFSVLVESHGFSINQKNNFGSTPLDMLEELREKVKKSGEFYNKNVIDRFINSLTISSENEEAAIKRFNAAQDMFVKCDSIYSLSNEVAKSKVLNSKFNDILYKTCVDILSDDSSKYPDVSNANFARLKQILDNNTLGKTLLNTDNLGNNFLQRLCLDIASKKVDCNSEKLVELFSKIVSYLDNKDPMLLQDLLFNHRNSNYENTIETLARVPDAYPVFKKLESIFSKHKISDSCDFYSMLVNAAGANDVGLYKYLCNNYAIDHLNNVDLFGDTSLHKAVITGSLNMVNAVLATGSDINKRNKKGNTPLHELLMFISSAPNDMVRPEHINLVKFLVSRGASLNAKNHCNNTPIDIASSIDKTKKLNQELDNPVSMLDSMVESRKDYYNIKNQCITELKPYITLSQGMEYKDVKFNVYGGILSAKVNSGKLKTSDLLGSKFCKENSLMSVKFEFSGKDKGYVQSVGNKRNYVVTDGSIKLKVSWQPVKPKGSKRQEVSVIINSDGSISLSDKDAEKYGVYGEKINFDCCKIYVGAIHLKDALANGKWRDKKFDLDKEQEKSDEKKPEQQDHETISGRSDKEKQEHEVEDRLRHSQENEEDTSLGSDEESSNPSIYEDARADDDSFASLSFGDEDMVELKPLRQEVGMEGLARDHEVEDRLRHSQENEEDTSLGSDEESSNPSIYEDARADDDSFASLSFGDEDMVELKPLRQEVGMEGLARDDEGLQRSGSFSLGSQQEGFEAEDNDSIMEAVLRQLNVTQSDLGFGSDEEAIELRPLRQEVRVGEVDRDDEGQRGRSFSSGSQQEALEAEDNTMEDASQQVNPTQAASATQSGVVQSDATQTHETETSRDRSALLDDSRGGSIGAETVQNLDIQVKTENVRFQSTGATTSSAGIEMREGVERSDSTSIHMDQPKEERESMTSAPRGTSTDTESQNKKLKENLCSSTTPIRSTMFCEAVSREVAKRGGREDTMSKFTSNNAKSAAVSAKTDDSIVQSSSESSKSNSESVARTRKGSKTNDLTEEILALSRRGWRKTPTKALSESDLYKKLSEKSSDYRRTSDLTQSLPNLHLSAEELNNASQIELSLKIGASCSSIDEISQGLAGIKIAQELSSDELPALSPPSSPSTSVSSNDKLKLR